MSPSTNLVVAAVLTVAERATRGVIRLMPISAYAVMLMVSLPMSSASADTIAVTPATPTSSDALTFRVDGISPFFVLEAQSQDLIISGNAIQLRACINNVGFSTPSTYVVIYHLAPLSPGVYTVDYLRAMCDLSGNVVVPYQLQASIQMSVLDSPSSVPTLGVAGLLVCVFLLVLTTRRQFTTSSE